MDEPVRDYKNNLSLRYYSVRYFELPKVNKDNINNIMIIELGRQMKKIRELKVQRTNKIK